jgi:steroid 5-alpha reductase family enzyme
LITFLLLKVSGVTLLERTIQDTRPGYQQYVERTSSFVPCFPKTARPSDGT